ncbi:serine hydrolase [Antrihabitans sp. YC2-6]|uniref:serine hydrolase domain-containing protein n=1 Tax=Antrihabitans sp. YC2-6 TaxID=2799498 RepID=UPI0018F5F855|nr:serine hydrolase domain-containing protein [Antrihabitans sp. YC2-6]MBJ8347172.1 beta-lactamase family protein [Antrihabitans sp. YC2-6]
MTELGHRHSRTVKAIALLFAANLVIAGCSDSTTGSDKETPTPSQCVPDVDKAISTKLDASAVTTALPADLVAKLDAAVQSSFKNDATPGAIVGVRTPKGTWIKAYGSSDTDTNAPMTADLHTRVGSITKTFTGTLLLQLAAQDKLSLDDPIDKYIAGVPNGDRVTLRLLSNMTSGVASYTFNKEFDEKLFGNTETVFTPTELVAYGVAKSPLFEPGAKYDYSNTNLVLLGLVIEKVTGQPVGEVFKKQIIEPLALTNTTWPNTSTELPAPYSQGYTLQGLTATPEKPANSTHWNPSWMWTAGGMISGMDDLLTYGRALATGQGLLPAPMQTERLTSFPESPDYAYGLSLACVDGWVGHTGETPGYNTSLYHDTTTDTTVIVQTNSDIASGSCTESPTLADNSTDIDCTTPSTRIEVAVTEALGHAFRPPAQK